MRRNKYNRFRETEYHIAWMDILDVCMSSASLDKVLTLRKAQDMFKTCRQGNKPIGIIRVCDALTLVDSATPAVSICGIKQSYITLLGHYTVNLMIHCLYSKRMGFICSKAWVINGDIVNRGGSGVEMSLLLNLFKLQNLEAMYINQET
ncbi:unnamed protein product [Albugo candida]|uniref:Uncharacterized protein n=1 Tax=Albugo candida TaxID=65357 RepID=A0A024GV51_9STRA|nr:unnamed protein product [Albugo candida]|eukprot:CCI50259.1 unnamed protein product [Albugo candida]